MANSKTNRVSIKQNQIFLLQHGYEDFFTIKHVWYFFTLLLSHSTINGRPLVGQSLPCPNVLKVVALFGSLAQFC